MAVLPEPGVKEYTSSVMPLSSMAFKSPETLPVKVWSSPPP